MATRAFLGPLAAQFPSTAFPQLQMINRRPVLAYDATIRETAYWTLVVPQGWTGTITVIIWYQMASATSGGVAWDVAFEAITSGDPVDLDAATSFDSDNTANETVPGTAGYAKAITVTISSHDSSAAGDYLRISISRDPSDAGDTATGDALLLGAELRDSA